MARVLDRVVGAMVKDLDEDECCRGLLCVDSGNFAQAYILAGSHILIIIIIIYTVSEYE